MADIPDSKLKRYFSEYAHPEKTKKEVVALLKSYKGLQLEQDTYVFNDGSQKSLINLNGTIPVQYKGLTYHIPVCIWLMDTHPDHAPICYVKPTADMKINISPNVDHTGKIYSPYLHTWSAQHSKLEGLLKVLSAAFSSVPPLYSSRSRAGVDNPSYMRTESGMPTPYNGNAATPGPANNTPYPTQSYMPMPGSNMNSPYPSYPTPGYPGYNPNAAANPQGSMYPPSYPPQPGSAGMSSYPPNMPYPYPQPGGGTPAATPYPMPNPSPAPPTNTGNTSSGTITDEHIKMSLKSAVEDKIRRKMNEQTTQAQEEIEILKETQNELNRGKYKLSKIFERIEKEKTELERNISFLKEKDTELDSILAVLLEKTDVDVDEAVTTTAPIYKQILTTFTEEAATEDTIYYMGEALRRGVIDLEVYLKQVRALSRRQFMFRALLFKCYKHISYVR
uniref:Tumor susceptibility gene 101 protein n=2 Tax=Cacopsylla melanoneura TaxID=428564 RepID=A0A8D8QAP5_9HEMI